MGLCENCNKNEISLPKLNKNESLIKYTYEVKNFNKAQIINNI